MYSEFQTPEKIENLFPEKLVETLSHPHPDGEKNLKNYISYLFGMHSYRDLKMGILMRAACISPFNNEINYWIIKTAFEHKKSLADFRQFLFLLVHAIPQSSFLWFYLQKSLDDSVKEKDYKELFETYCPENIDKTFNQISPEMASELLSSNSSHIAELNDACIYFAIGNYASASQVCVRITTEEKYKDLPKISIDIATDILICCVNEFNKILVRQIFTKPDQVKASNAVIEFEKGNHEAAIKLINEIVTDEKEFEKYSRLEISTLCFFSSQCCERKNDNLQALHMLEASYPDHYLIFQGKDQLSEMMLTSIIRVISNLRKNGKSSSNGQPGLFELNADQLYDFGKDLHEKKNYNAAIKYFNAALAIYAKDELLTKDCAKCYLAVALAYIQLDLLISALKKCQMAHAITMQVYGNPSPELFIVEKELLNLEVKMAVKKHGIHSNSAARCNKKLGMLYEKYDDLASARIAYKLALDIYQKINGKDDPSIPEINARLEDITNNMNKSRPGKK